MFRVRLAQGLVAAFVELRSKAPIASLPSSVEYDMIEERENESAES